MPMNVRIWGKKIYDVPVLQRRQRERVIPVSETVIDPSPLYLFLWLSQQTVSSSNMMPAAKGMSQMMPNHVLRVGQTIRLDSQETVHPHPFLVKPSGNNSDADLDVSLDNLNQLILELDPTFEPLQVNKSPLCSPATGTVWREAALCCVSFVSSLFKRICYSSFLL